ncbi:Conserved_hypothetical protein [Hexamita inflata]|uniref:Uncharacterized protein n=1 Tax=Hexamita inflata TaxID=28002 RepID=A0AA86NVD5_9EUKA|nr:Conserved hypothetical protein [Hexamita inflata]CAI9969465.1 Conserved hypothetical protein [Hexamita inflata]
MRLRHSRDQLPAVHRLLQPQPHNTFKHFNANYFTANSILALPEQQDLEVQSNDNITGQLQESCQLIYQRDHLFRILDPVKQATQTAFNYSIGYRCNRFESLESAIKFLRKQGQFYNRYSQIVLSSLNIRHFDVKPVSIFPTNLQKSHAYCRLQQIQPKSFYLPSVNILSNTLKFLCVKQYAELMTKSFPNTQVKQRFLQAIEQTEDLQSAFNSFLQISSILTDFDRSVYKQQFLQVIDYVFKQQLFYLFLINNFINDYNGIETVINIKQQLDQLTNLDNFYKQIAKDVVKKEEEGFEISAMKQTFEAQLKEKLVEKQTLVGAYHQLVIQNKQIIQQKENEKMKQEDLFSDSLRLLNQISPKITLKTDEVKQNGLIRDTILKDHQSQKLQIAELEEKASQLRLKVQKNVKQYELEQQKYNSETQKIQKTNQQLAITQKKNDENFAVKWRQAAESQYQQLSLKRDFSQMWQETVQICQQLNVDPGPIFKPVLREQINQSLKPKDQLRNEIDCIFNQFKTNLNNLHTIFEEIRPSAFVKLQEDEVKKQKLSQRQEELLTQFEQIKLQQIEIRQSVDQGGINNQKWKLISQPRTVQIIEEPKVTSQISAQMERVMARNVSVGLTITISDLVKWFGGEIQNNTGWVEWPWWVTVGEKQI